MKMAFRSPRMAHSRLTNGAMCYRLLLDQNIKANCAECATTSHSSHPTLSQPVNGLRFIIQKRETPVLRGFRGPTDSFVGLGCFVVPGWERVQR